MYPFRLLHALLLGVNVAAVAIPTPTPTPVPTAVQIRAPLVTPAAFFFSGDRSYDKRNLISDIASGADKVAKSWGSVL
jgi:hypothetical protein